MFGFRAQTEGRDLLEILKAEGMTDLIERLETLAKAREKRENQTQEELTPEASKKAEVPVERHSARQIKKKEDIEKKEKQLEDDEMDWEHINWETVTETDKLRWKQSAEQKEQEMMEKISELSHGYAIVPLGRDRTFRRYWVFRSITGVFVEDQECIIDDCLQPVEQVVKPAFRSDSLPLNTDKTDQNGEKSISSDKENDLNESGEPQTVSDRTDLKPQVLAENGIAEVSPERTETAMEVDKSSVTYENVHEQIVQRNQVRWAFYNTPEQLDKLIGALNARGYREGALKQVLQEQKKHIEMGFEECPVDMLQVSHDREGTSDKGTKTQNVKSRNRIMQGKVDNASATELLELNLRELLLDLEERMYMGSLGAMKV